MTNEARSDDNQATSSATSSGRPRRPIGWAAMSMALTAASAYSALSIGVWMKPGPTALMRMPLAP